MAAFQQSVAASARKHGGVVTQFSGDGAMVVFGLIAGSAPPADGALSFIAALAHEAARWPSSGMRIGADLGPVVAGVMGGSSHRQVTVAGDAVNVASRLQGEAKARDAALAVSDALIAASEEPESWEAQLGLKPAGPCRLRGRGEMLEIWIAARFPR